MSVDSAFPLTTDYSTQHIQKPTPVISFPVSKQAKLQEHRSSPQTPCLPFCSPSAERGADKAEIYLQSCLPGL